MNEHRQMVEREADEDLKKEPRILLHDIHDELLKPGGKFEEKMAHASKRIASMQVKVALKNEETAVALLSNTEAMKTLLDTLESYAAKSEKRTAANEMAVAKLNRWMLSLTIAGVFLAIAAAVFGGMSVWYAYKSDRREALRAPTEAPPKKAPLQNTSDPNPQVSDLRSSPAGNQTPETEAFNLPNPTQAPSKHVEEQPKTDDKKAQP
jgi:hypothetical protein